MSPVRRRLVALATLCAALFLALSTAHAQVFVRQWGSQGSGPGQFTWPWGIGVDASGVVYVGDQSRIQRFTPDGDWLGEFSPLGTEPEQVQSLYGLHVSSDGHVWVADPGGNKVAEFDAGGQYVRHIGGPYDFELPDGALGAPLSVTLDGAGNIYTVEFDSPRIQKFDANGQFVTKWMREGGGFGSVVADRYGQVYTGEPNAFCVRRWSLGGSLLGELCDFGETQPGNHSNANGLATDAAGNLYVTVGLGFRVFSPSGALMGRVGRTDGMRSSEPGEFSEAVGIAVGPDGSIYVVDRWNHRVQKFAFAPVPTLPTTWGRLKSIYR